MNTLWLDSTTAIGSERSGKGVGIKHARKKGTKRPAASSLERKRGTRTTTEQRITYAFSAKGRRPSSRRLPHLLSPATTWDCEISSLRHGWIVGREANPEVRPAPSKTQERFIRSDQLRILGSVPQLCLHPVPRLPRTGDPTVCNYFHLRKLI